MSVLGTLRRNDPATREIYIWLALENDDEALADALERHGYLRRVIIVFIGHEQRAVSVAVASPRTFLPSSANSRFDGRLL